MQLESRVTQSDILDPYKPYTFTQVLKRSLSGFVYTIHSKNCPEPLILKIIPLDNLQDPSFKDKKTAVEEEYSNMVLLHYCKSFVQPIDSRYYEKDGHGFFDILMEHCGKSLSDVKFDKSITLETKIDWMKQCMSAMAYAEGKNIYHGDIKPHNMLIKNGTILKLIDLGGSRSLGTVTYKKTVARVTKEVREFTPCYASPELLEARPPIIINKLDVYAFGKTFYEILYGFTTKEMEQERMKLCVTDGSLGFLKTDEDTYNKWNKSLLSRNIPGDESKGEHSEIVNEILSLCLEFNPHNRPTFSELEAFMNAKLTILEADKIEEKDIENTDDEKDVTVKYTGRLKPEDEVGKSKFINLYENYTDLFLVHADYKKLICFNMVTNKLSSYKLESKEYHSMAQSIMIAMDKVLLIGGKMNVGYSRTIYEFIIKQIEERKVQKSQPKTQPKGKPAFTFTATSKELGIELLFPRAFFGCVFIKGKVHVLGGITDGEELLKSCEVISTEDKVVAEIAPLSKAKESMAVCNYQDKWIFVFGGRYQDFKAQDNMMNNYSNIIEQYDINSKNWTVISLKDDSLYKGSIYSGAVPISLEEVLIFGGIMKYEAKENEKEQSRREELKEGSEVIEQTEPLQTNFTLLFKSVEYQIKSKSFTESNSESSISLIFTGFIGPTYFVNQKVYAFSSLSVEETDYRVYVYDVKMKTWKFKTITYGRS